MNLLKKFILTSAIILTMMLAACAPMQPWEHGNLAKPQMALDPYPLQSALKAHNYGSREAAAGGKAAVAVTKVKSYILEVETIPRIKR
jgi:Domain of unknown function (DUF4266)